ncbi:MAG: hypothetical protein ACOY82_15190 [Pseudomonadota bacterium]
MSHRLRRFVVCVVVPWLWVCAVAQAAEAPVKPTDAEGWRALALRDLEAMRAVLRDQTPIPFDTENAAYPRWLEDGYAQAQARIAQVRDESGYFYALAAYSNGFRDPHIDLDPTGELPTPRWPGFIAAARGDDAVVVYRDADDPDAPLIGTILHRCDGETLPALAQARVFPFTLNAGLPADRRRAITRLFLDRNNPFAPAPTRCLFREADILQERTLRWRDVAKPDAAYWTAYSNATLGPPAPWGLSEPAPGVFWIGVPTFSSDGDAAPKLQALLDAVNARADAMRQAKAIVIDTRGNGGGNSMWADRLAEAVFTRKVLDDAAAALPKRREAVDWRGSRENVAYWRAWSKEIASQLSPGDKRWLKKVVRGLEGAEKRQPPIWRQGEREVDSSGGLTALRPRDAASPFPARVYMLSNGSCGSSCLNFADRILLVPGVRLIGSATSGDGPYMEVRNETLPSGLAQVTFPQKVYRGMARGALEVYAPDVAYDGAWDDASVRAWTLASIAAEIAGER